MTSKECDGFAFPLVDRNGAPTRIEDEAIGQLALVLKVSRCFVEVAFVDTGASEVYRRDEIQPVYDKEE